MATKLSLIIKDLDKELAPLEAKRKAAFIARLSSFDFSDKNYYSGVEQQHEASITIINKAKDIVTKHLK